MNGHREQLHNRFDGSAVFVHTQHQVQLLRYVYTDTEPDIAFAENGY